MFQYFGSYEEFNYKSNNYSLADVFWGNETVDHLEHVFTIVIDNYKIVGSCNKWAKLQYLEANCIKNQSHKINFSWKTSKKLVNLNRLMLKRY